MKPRASAGLLPCRTFESVPISEKVSYRIPLVPNARRFRAGHKLRLCLTTDDQNAARPALLEFRHASVGTSSFNTVFAHRGCFCLICGKRAIEMGDAGWVVSYQDRTYLKGVTYKRIYAEVASNAMHWASRDATSSGTRIITDRSHDACSSRALSSLPPVFAASV